MFLNFLMLAGVGGAAVPLVLHLTSKARYRTVEWGAMMFLEAGESQRRHAARLKQFVLLALRMAIVATLAVALARPVVRGSWGGAAAAGGGRVTAVIVLDRSASMAFEEGVAAVGGQGHTRLDLAREAVLQILRGLDRGDQVSLVLTGDSASRAAGVVAPTGDRQAVADRVIQARPGFGRADMAESLTTAMNTLERFEPSNRQLYVVCDRQAASWAGVNDAFADAWAPRANAAAAPVRGFVVPVGGEQTDNVAVESVSLANPPVVRGGTGELEVTVRNYGARPRTGLPLAVRQGDRGVFDTVVNLAPEAAATVRVPLLFPDAGAEPITAGVKSTGLTIDDELEYAADVVEPIRTLVVSGDERGGASGTDSQYVRAALAPFAAAGRAGADPARVTVVPGERFDARALAGQQVVVLADVIDLAPHQARAIEEFAYAGGGLLVAPGRLSRYDGYNRALYRDGWGVLPGVLRPPVPDDPASATTLQSVDLAHPAFGFLRGRPDPAPPATVGRYFPVIPREGGARVIAGYASGSPFAVDAPYGRGRVLLLTTPLDAAWGTLPQTNFFLPFVQSAVRYLAAANYAGHNLDAGQELVAPFDEAPPDRRATVTAPDGTRHPVEVSAAGDHFEARFAATDQPGGYTVEARLRRGSRAERYVVRPPREESDLTPLTPDAWARLERTTGLRRIELGRQSVADALGTARDGRELWLTLLLAVLALATAEMAFSRFWSSGAR